MNLKPIPSKTETLEFDTPDWVALRDEKLMEWLEDRHAANFFGILAKSTELFDDIVDGDPVSEGQIFDLMMSLWLHLPNNPFWITYRRELTPLLITATNAWLDANVLEKGSETDRVYAYVYRNLTLHAIPFAVFLLHGQARMREVSLDIHRFFTEHETFREYCAEHEDGESL